MKLVLIGARSDGQAHLVLDLLAETREHEVVAFLDETPSLWGTRVHDVPVLGPPSDAKAAADLGAEGGMVSIGSGEARERLAKWLEQAGLAEPTLVHPSAHVAASATLGRGVFVGAQAGVNSGAVLGDRVLVAPTAFVSHHVRVGAAATLSPGSRLGGRSQLGERAFLGLGATLLPDRRVGDDATVGAAALVNRDVAPGATVAGVPARVLRP